MIDYVQALQRLLAQVSPSPVEHCPLAEASGRVLAADVRCPIALPTFDHAAMDGYALCAREPLAAGSEHAVEGSQAAGDDPCASRDVASEIMTGACLPDGLDAVVALERTELLATRADGTPARIRLLDPLVAGTNVRVNGTDVAQGVTVLAAGMRIGPNHIMLLAALGVASIAVVRQPRIAIICTGKELQPDPAQPLAAGRIHNSNGPYLMASLTAAGAKVLSCETVDDTATTYVQALQRAVDAKADLVISTGAVSMGRYDFVPDTLRQLGAELLFHKVAIRPGKPLLCARLANGPLILALPGTPMAVAVGFRFFVVPVLRGMAGQGGEPAICAVLDTAQQPKAGLRHFLLATLHQDATGRLHASVSSRQQPFRIGPFAGADTWVVLSEESGDAAIGTQVAIVGLDPCAPMHLHAAHSP
jgi:molybdopterin molybdotransferase